jgi:hypothetical protein
MKALRIYVLIAVLCFIPHVQGAWTAERLEAATEHMRQYRKDWTAADTEKLLTHGPDRAVNMAGSISGFIRDDRGGIVRVMVSGDTVLVNGRDISGNLGSKTTYGAHSPIIENIRDSQVAAAQGSSVVKDSTSNLTINVSLSIALSASVALNLYLLRRLRRREVKRGAPAEAVPTEGAGPA